MYSLWTKFNSNVGSGIFVYLFLTSFPISHIKSLTFGNRNCRTTPPTVIMIAIYNPMIPTFVESKNPIMLNSAATNASL